MIQLIVAGIFGLLGLYGLHNLLKSKKKFTPDDPYKFKWEPVIIVSIAAVLMIWLVMR